jgi:drug/metabolite transporter (DMT)-like permease
MARPLATDDSSPAVGPKATPGTTRLRVYLTLAAGILCIAFSAIFTRWAQVPGTVSAFYRVAIAAVALAVPFARVTARRRVRVAWPVWLLAAGAGIFFALDLGLWNTSLFLTPAATATLLGNDAPIIVGLGALLLFRERLGWLYWVGLALALLGMLAIVGPDVLTRSSLGAGDLLALTAGAAYGAYLLATQRIRAHLDTLSSLWVAGVVGAVLLLIFDLITRQQLWGFSVRTYVVLLALGLIIQVGGWLAINYALGHLPASIVSVTLLAQPILTAIFAVPLLGETLSGAQIIGGALALSGIYLVNRGRGPASPPAQHAANG